MVIYQSKPVGQGWGATDLPHWLESDSTSMGVARTRRAHLRDTQMERGHSEAWLADLREHQSAASGRLVQDAEL